MGVKQLLVVGAGPKGAPVPREFQAYQVTTLDIDPALEPDIVGSMVAMPMIADGSFDAVLASHCLEHLYFHEAAMALHELRRVLKPGGIVRINVPDLQCIGGLIALDKADTMVYQGGMGPVTPLDMLYGHRGDVAKGNLWMAHKMGYTGSVLKALLGKCDFEKIEIDRDTKFELVARGTKPAKETALEDEAPMSTSAAEASYARTEQGAVAVS